MFLLDTHVLVWFFQADDRLGATARERIVEASTGDAATVSAISFWEVAMLQRKGRLDLGMRTDRWTISVLDNPGIRLLVVDALIAAEAGQLSDDIHGDPIDRILIATARHMRVPMLTADRAILGHAAAGHLEAIDARD